MADADPTSTEILAELRALRAEQAELLRIVAPLVTRKLSRAAQAKRAGCSVRTLQLRERKARAQIALSRLPFAKSF